MSLGLATVLIADGDSPDRGQLRDLLEQEGFLVRVTGDGRAVLSQLRREIPHLILLDLELPFLGGTDLCQHIKRFGDVPIVVLTGLDDEATKLEVLDQYAEDYILKPASFPEVVARIRRILRRTWFSCLPTRSNLQIDERLILDFIRQEAQTPQGIFHLTPLESRLLQLLVRNSGQVLPTELLLERLWGDAHISPTSLWEHIRRLRRKIGDDAARPRYIVTEPGLGYSFTSTTIDSAGGQAQTWRWAKSELRHRRSAGAASPDEGDAPVRS